jgi:hypothetical protein
MAFPSLSFLPVVRRLVAERVPVFDVVVIVGVVDVVAVVAFFCHQWQRRPSRNIGDDV